MSQNLFNLDEIPDISKQKSSSRKVSDKLIARKIKVKDTLNDLIGKIEKGTSIHYASVSEWSQHELLRHLLNQTGPAKVWIATWSMSEPGATQVLQLCNEGMITQISCVFDWRIKIRCVVAHQIAKFNFAQIHLTTCHAKVTVIETDNFNISIVTSANYTNNPRIEAGVITESKEIADFHKAWIIETLNNSKPFE
jgi:hypothetical protein